MFDKRPRTERELKKLFSNLKRKGITDDMAHILIELCYNRQVIMRTSGFYWPGAPDLEMTWDDELRTLTLTPREAAVGGTDAEDYIPHFRFYSWAGEPVFHRMYEPQLIQLPDQEGLYVVYFDVNEDDGQQKLFYLHNPEAQDLAMILIKKVVVSFVYWDFSNQEALYYGNALHGSEWNPFIHWWAHGAFSAIREKGLRITDIEIGDGSLDKHAYFGISAGSVFHEDMKHSSDGIHYVFGLPVYYLSEAGPRYLIRPNFSVDGETGECIFFNENTELVTAESGSFVFCHVFWTNCRTRPLISVMGQARYDQATEAVDAYIAELEKIDTWLPHQSKMWISSVLFETDTEFANSIKARIVGEMTPDDIAGIETDDRLPSVKTGWDPEVLTQARFLFNEVDNVLQLYLEEAFTTYFVEGIKHKVTGSITFPALPDVLGLNHITGNGNAWSSEFPEWDEAAVKYVKVLETYRNPRRGQTQYLGWRMHNWSIDATVRANLIKKTGLEKLSGFEITINATNNWELDVADGVMRLAEITADVIHNRILSFGQHLRSLVARRHYLKTYVDETDPENPVTTHEWEYQHLTEGYVATLSAGNEVVINEQLDGAWQLTETADGDYTAMWLLLTMDAHYPLKWLTGTAAAADLEEAKELNNAESIRTVINGAPFICSRNTYQVIARVMVKNIAAAPYYELAEIEEYDDGEFDNEANDRHVTAMQFNPETRMLSLTRNAGLPGLQAEIPGGTQQQSDWNQSDTEAPDYIKNKPTIPEGGEDNVQSDWNQTDSEADDYIKNKPAIPDSTCQTANSITGDGTEENPLQFVNDEEAPGGPKYYGTNTAGEKGYHPLTQNSQVYIPEEPTWTFPTPVDINVFSLRVYVEGARLYPAEYTATPTEVTLNEKVYPGQVVQIFFDTYKSSEHIIGEIPAGAIDGSNRSFTLAHTPDPARLEIYRTGVLQKAAFFSLAANVFTLTNKIYPGEWLRTDYWTVTGADSGSYNLTPTGVVNGANKTFTLSFAPSYAMIYLERVRQLEGTDYSITGDQLVFTKAPKTGQRILTDLIL